jgi:hypothetical protein
MGELMDDCGWRTEVQAAVLREDRELLKKLFDEAVHQCGQAIASQAWLQIMSGFDARAATG